jgi:hypothetical protein
MKKLEPPYSHLASARVGMKGDLQVVALSVFTLFKSRRLAHLNFRSDA